MDMMPVAEFVVTNALLLVLLTMASTLAVVFIAWHLFNRVRVPIWSLAVDGWDALRNSSIATRLRNRSSMWSAVLDRPLSSPVYLGLHTALGFLLLAPALALFLSLADEVMENDWLTRFDVALATLLARTASSEVLVAAAMVTRLGDALTLYVLGAIVALVLCIRRDWLILSGWLITTIGNGLLIRLLKGAIQRSRPEHLHGLVAEGSYSFPSGHSQGSMVVYGMLAYLIARALPASVATAWQYAIMVAAGVLVMVVGVSRIVLHVHYFSDVIAGFACGVCWLALCITGLEMALRHYRRLGEVGQAVSV
ncbi:hypothetical protein BH09PSE5_BH09PSE5_39280 [soil metagenome]